MNNNIKQILEEIYMVDSGLKKHEQDLEKIIIELTNQKPDVKIDQVFIKNLKEKLMSQVNPAEENAAAAKPRLFTLPNFAFLGVGALAMLLIMLPFVGQRFGGEKAEKAAKNETANKPADQIVNKIVALGSHAFGSISQNGGQKGALATGGDAAKAAGNSAAAPMSAESSAPMATRAIGMGGGGGSFMADAKMGIMPPMYNYVYKYAGDEFTVEGGEAEVYKKVPGQGFSVSAENILGNLNVPLIDISKLQNSQIQSLSIMEDKDFGLQASINLADGSVDFNQNWLKWQEHFPKCTDEKCWEQNRLKIEDVPSDEAIIRIADDFLSSYGISLSDYGPGEIHAFWRKDYEKAADKSAVYIPEDVQVVYPLKVKDQVVYDTSGNPSGVNVNVNIKYMKVSGMYSLRNNSYESSTYQLEGDKDRILKIAEKGGNGGPIYYANAEGTKGGQKTETIELGTPKKILLDYWYWDQKKQESSELYIPALVFPITKAPESQPYFYQQSVVIPLVKEILDTYDNQDNGGVRPLMMKGGAADDVASPAATETAPAATSEPAPATIESKPMVTPRALK